MTKKWPKMTEKYICYTPYLSKHTSFDHVFLLQKFKMMTSPDAFFIFSKFRLLGEGGGVKGKKSPKITVLLCISGTVSHMIVLFGAHV